jgi:hypothetical protein
MKLIFTAKKTPFSSNNVINTPPTTAPEPVPVHTNETADTNTTTTPEVIQGVRSLETYSKYKSIASMPDTFSDRATVFSGKNMLTRVGFGISGCSSCGLRKQSNKPLKKNNIY